MPQGIVAAAVAGTTKLTVDDCTPPGLPEPPPPVELVIELVPELELELHIAVFAILVADVDTQPINVHNINKRNHVPLCMLDYKPVVLLEGLVAGMD